MGALENALTGADVVLTVNKDGCGALVVANDGGWAVSAADVLAAG
jgi:hypothetical protein